MFFGSILRRGFTLDGRGTVVVGCIETGTFHEGDIVSIVSPMGPFEATISGIEQYRKFGESSDGEHVGFLLRGVKSSIFTKGDILVKML